MEDKENGLVTFRGCLLFDQRLVFAEELRVQLDVARLVYTMDIPKAGSDGKKWAYFGQGAVNVINVVGLRVEGVVVNIFVVDPVFFTTCDSDFLLTAISHCPLIELCARTHHFQELLHGGRPLEVLGCRIDIEFDGLLR